MTFHAKIYLERTMALQSKRRYKKRTENCKIFAIGYHPTRDFSIKIKRKSEGKYVLVISFSTIRMSKS